MTGVVFTLFAGLLQYVAETTKEAALSTVTGLHGWLPVDRFCQQGSIAAVRDNTMKQCV